MSKKKNKNNQLQSRQPRSQSGKSPSVVAHHPGGGIPGLGPNPPQSLMIRQQTSSTFHGPIPPPELLARYDDIEPGFAGRIIAMAEKEQAHRHGTDNAILRGTFSIKQFGQRCAVFIASLGLLISGLLIYCDKTTGGTFLGGATLTLLVIAFLTGRGKDESETDEAVNEEDSHDRSGQSPDKPA